MSSENLFIYAYVDKNKQPVICQLTQQEYNSIPHPIKMMIARLVEAETIAENIVIVEKAEEV